MFLKDIYNLEKQTNISSKNLNHFGEVKFPYKISKNGSPQQFRFCSTLFTTIGDNFRYFKTCHIGAHFQA